MKFEITLPKMGESITEGTIIKWHKKPGDRIKKDEVLYEISTDKVDTEIPSPADGVVTEILVPEQETVLVDTLVAVIDTEGKSDEAGNKEDPVYEKKELLTAVEGKENPPASNGHKSLIDIPMPKMGESVVEGTIIKWHKKVGDNIIKDEILFEISTDKVDTEVPSPVEGVLSEILVAEQETVEVGTIVAKVAAKVGESNGAEKIIEPEPIPVKIKKEEPAPVIISSQKENVSTNVEEYKEVENIPIDNDSKFYSPLVLNIARKEKVTFEELESINGTGISGRVTKNDILNYIKNRPKEKPVQPKPAAKTPPVKSKKAEEFEYGPVKELSKAGTTELIPMDNIRQKIMQHMILSRDTSVHVSGVIEVDMTRIHNFIKKNKEEYLKKENIKLTYMPFIAHACINALKENPYINASIDGNNISLKKFINLGFAVALEPNGLIVPNIKNADEKNIRGLAKAINELSDKARTKRLTPDDISNGTFTITNYGIFGTLFGTPIINQPEVAILGVGTITKKPVVIEADGADTIAVRSMMYLSLSHDHRLVDGMAGGKFLKMIKDTLENFDISSI